MPELRMYSSAVDSVVKHSVASAVSSSSFSLSHWIILFTLDKCAAELFLPLHIMPLNSSLTPQIITTFSFEDHSVFIEYDVPSNM